MYGSIFNLKPKKEKKEALIDHLKNDQDRPEGGVAWYVLNPDNDGDLVGIAIFKDNVKYNNQNIEAFSDIVIINFLTKEIDIKSKNQKKIRIKKKN